MDGLGGPKRFHFLGNVLVVKGAKNFVRSLGPDDIYFALYGGNPLNSPLNFSSGNVSLSTPLTPLHVFSQNLSLPVPLGLTTPSPVTTTRCLLIYFDLVFSQPF